MFSLEMQQNLQKKYKKNIKINEIDFYTREVQKPSILWKGKQQNPLLTTRNAIKQSKFVKRSQ